MAAAEALNTPELLEQVLLHLSAQDLLFSQRVASLWRGTVQRRDEFQRRLFRKPVTKCEEWTSLVVCKKLLFPASHIINAVTPTKLIEAKHDPEFLVVAEANPFLEITATETEDHRELECAAADVVYAFRHVSCQRGTIQRPLSLKSTESGLLDMYLTQPPITLVFVWIKPSWTTGIAVQNENGITVRNVIEKVRGDFRDYPETDILPTISVDFHNFLLFIPDRWRAMFDRGIEKFRKIESKVGRKNSFRIAGRDSLRCGRCISTLLEGDHLDKIVAMGKVDAVADGAWVPEILAEYEENQKLESAASEVL